MGVLKDLLNGEIVTVPGARIVKASILQPPVTEMDDIFVQFSFERSKRPNYQLDIIADSYLGTIFYLYEKNRPEGLKADLKFIRSANEKVIFPAHYMGGKWLRDNIIYYFSTTGKRPFTHNLLIGDNEEYAFLHLVEN